MQNVYVMSHASDIDGVGSAALIKKKFALPDSHLFFTVYSSESIEYVNKMLKGRYASGLTLFIADLGVNDSIADSYLRILKQVKAHGGKVFWFDHHPWTNKAIKMLTPLCDAAIIGENSEYCATEITQKELGLNDSFSKIFTKIVHYSDFNITPKSKSDHKTVGAYALSITYYNTNKSWGKITAKLRHIADVISKGKLLDATITADANKFQKINEDRTREMITDLTVRKDFALGFSKHIQSTYACAAIMQSSKKKIAIYVNFENGRGHIRSEVSDISTLARALGGGGHPHAAGFDINAKKFGNFKTEYDKERFADFIEQKISSL